MSHALPDFRHMTLEQRLEPFLRAGLVPRLPTRWQLFQGQVEMLLYVLLPGETDADRYEGTLLGNPILRQPITLWHVGWNHLRLGSGLGAPAEALFRHLMFVHHEGFPDYDLQLIQTHPDGIARFREFIREIDEGDTRKARRLRRATRFVVPDTPGYRRRFLEQDGWLDRADALAYGAADTGDDPPEFATLVSFVNHCARAHPSRPSEIPPARMPGHLWRLFTRRLRSEGGFVRRLLFPRRPDGAPPPG
jgi:hypothetical protein